MSISHQTLSHSPLVWENVLPPGFAGLRLPGATLNSAKGEFGNICIQEFDTPEYSIQYNHFTVENQFTLQSTSGFPGLYSKLVLKGKWLERPRNHSPLQFRANQVSLLNTHSFISRSIFPRGLHISFETFFSLPLLGEISSLFPGHPALTNKLNWVPLWSNMEINETVVSILRCSHDKELRRHFFNSRVRDLLFGYLLLPGPVSHEEKQPSGKEMDAVLKAEQIITSDISKHIQIPELSKKVLLNEFDLKSLFKKVFGVGPYEYLVIQRLKKGKELLETGYTVKQAAAAVGYRPSDFTTAFTRYFGTRPSTIKKKDS